MAKNNDNQKDIDAFLALAGDNTSNETIPFDELITIIVSDYTITPDNYEGECVSLTNSEGKVYRIFSYEGQSMQKAVAAKFGDEILTPFTVKVLRQKVASKTGKTYHKMTALVMEDEG